MHDREALIRAIIVLNSLTGCPITASLVLSQRVGPLTIENKNARLVIRNHQLHCRVEQLRL
jgi:hypothetical protein